AVAFGHRVRNEQPLGGWVAEGTGPERTIGSTSCSRLGVAEKNARVYGWRAAFGISPAGASSTIRPRYMVTIRSLTFRTVWMSWDTNTIARLRRSRRSTSRFRIWARTDT